MNGPTPSATGVEARVLDIIAEMSGRAPGNIGCSLHQHDAPLDSLTAIAIITRIEAAFGIVVDDAVFELLIASDFGRLSRLIAQVVAAQPAKPGEAARNERCERNGDALQCE